MRVFFFRVLVGLVIFFFIERSWWRGEVGVILFRKGNVSLGVCFG